MTTQSTSSKKSIIIVGAGISGLQAAHTLLTHPAANLFNVIVLEASDRIGGRVNTKWQWGFPLDYGTPPRVYYLISIGASYIHGTEENPLTHIAKAVGATLIPRKSSDQRLYFDHDGVAAGSSDSRLIYRKISEYADAALEFSREHSIDKDTTVGSFFNQRIKEDVELTTDAIRRMVSSGVEMLSHSAGCDLDKLSLKYYWTDDDLPVKPHYHFI
jgi:monoamine oxidase